MLALQMLVAFGVPAAVLVAAARFRHLERMRCEPLAIRPSVSMT